MRWLARNEYALPADPGWLSRYEAERAAGYRFPKRRAEYLLRRYTAKQAVAAATGLPVDLASLARVEIRNAPSGAPYAVVHGTPAGVALSLTDRAGWAVCVVGTGTVGCDLELVEPRSAGFVHDFLTRAERDRVARSADPDAAANLFWSAKESALKVLRTGLRRGAVLIGTLLAGLAPWALLRGALLPFIGNILAPFGIGPLTLTDTYLRDYANMYGDLSAGSGLNALKRDQDHARDFLHRHQDKLIYGSDCDDHFGYGEQCQGAQTIAMVRKLITESKVRRKLFWSNARRVFRI